MIDFDNGLLPDAFPGTQHSNNLHARSSKPSSRSARDMISVILAGGGSQHQHTLTNSPMPSSHGCGTHPRFDKLYSQRPLKLNVETHNIYGVFTAAISSNLTPSQDHYSFTLESPEDINYKAETYSAQQTTTQNLSRYARPFQLPSKPRELCLRNAFVKVIDRGHF
jgi:hypothetical protein